MVLKTCVQCGRSKPLSEFEKNTDNRKVLAHPFSQGCRLCINATKALLRRLKRGADRLTLQERFEQYFQPLPWSGCFVWTGGLSTATKGIQHACGEFNVEANGRRAPEPAYRTSWKLYRGPIPEGKHVLHRCDNRLCVNPDHLFLGTHRQNMYDMIVKGRHPTMKVCRKEVTPWQ